jgi:DNA-binding NarL/FixJ family response regulator
MDRLILVIDRRSVIGESLQGYLEARLPGMKVMTLGRAQQAVRLRFLPVACTITSEAEDIPSLRGAFPGAAHLLFLSAGRAGPDDLDPDLPVLMPDMPGAAFAETIRIAIEASAAPARHRTNGSEEEAADEEDDREDREDRTERRTLSAREYQVLRAIKRGLPNKLIADELRLSENTVKIYVRNVMRKMGVSNRTMAALARVPAPDAMTVPPTPMARLS